VKVGGGKETNISRGAIPKSLEKSFQVGKK